MQLNYYNSRFEKRQFPIVLICNNVTNAPNIGSLFRTADAFGIEKLIFCGTDIHIGRKMTKTSRATEKTVPFDLNLDIVQTVEDYKERGYQIIALEITEFSTPIHNFSLDPSKPIALIVGDENFGIHEWVLSNSDVVLHIDMYGQNSSMNVVQATTIALYEFTKKLI